MKIDWEKVSQCPGYISLKACMDHDLKKSYRSKEELLKQFQWVIGRATHYVVIGLKNLNEPLTNKKENTLILINILLVVKLLPRL